MKFVKQNFTRYRRHVFCYTHHIDSHCARILLMCVYLVNEILLQNDELHDCSKTAFFIPICRICINMKYNLKYS